MRVYLDGSTDPADLTDALMLHAVSVDPFGWNGYAVPVVTGAEFARFISAWQRNDPNGTWHAAGVAEGDGALVYRDAEGNDPSVWTVAAMVDGSPVYALAGWQWSGVSWDANGRNEFDSEFAL